MPIALAVFIAVFGVGAAAIIRIQRERRERKIRGVVTVGPIRFIRPDATIQPEERPPQPTPSQGAPTPTPADAAQRQQMLAELQTLRRWAEALSIYTRAMWAGDLLRMKARAESLNAAEWPTVETARFLVEARALRARIAA